MTKSRNLNATYDFGSLKKGTPILIPAINPHSARTRAHQYAKANGFRVKTWLTDAGVVVLAY